MFRKLLLSALLIAGLCGQANQIPGWPPAKFVGASCSTPLDAISGDPVAAAFGLQKLRNAYSGNAIDVFRESTSSTISVGFNGCDLDTATISSFCSGTTCHVSTYYDQSGNGANCAFHGGFSLWPVITLNIYNGHPKLAWAGGERCDATFASSVTASTFIAVGSFSSSGAPFPAMLSTEASTDGLVLVSVIGTPDVRAQRTVSSTNFSGTKSVTLDAIHTFAATMNNTLSRIFVDGAAGTDDTTSTTLVAQSTLNIGQNIACGTNCNFQGDVEVAIVLKPDVNSTDVGTALSPLKTYWGTP